MSDEAKHINPSGWVNPGDFPATEERLRNKLAAAHSRIAELETVIELAEAKVSQLVDLDLGTKYATLRDGVKALAEECRQAVVATKDGDDGFAKGFHSASEAFASNLTALLGEKGE